MNYYQTLGVEKTSTSDDIKKAYRKLAMKFHPDRGGDEEHFKKIKEAYETLSDPAKKAQYDAEQAGGFRHFRFNTNNTRNFNNDIPDEILEIFRRQFGTDSPFGQYSRPHRAPRNPDVKIGMQIPIASTLEEQEKTLEVTIPNSDKTRTITIKVPRGVHHGATIRYPGLGDSSDPTLPKGDLYIQFFHIADPNFQQVGIDLVTRLTINCLEAITGCEKEVVGIDGKIFKLNIPAGTQVNSKFGIRDQGLFSTQYAGRGKLIVLLEIYIPKELTDEQLKTITTIQKSL